MSRLANHWCRLVESSAKEEICTAALIRDRYSNYLKSVVIIKNILNLGSIHAYSMSDIPRWLSLPKLNLWWSQYQPIINIGLGSSIFFRMVIHEWLRKCQSSVLMNVSSWNPPAGSRRGMATLIASNSHCWRQCYAKQAAKHCVFLLAAQQEKLCPRYPPKHRRKMHEEENWSVEVSKLRTLGRRQIACIYPNNSYTINLSTKIPALVPSIEGFGRLEWSPWSLKYCWISEESACFVCKVWCPTIHNRAAWFDLIWLTNCVLHWLIVWVGAFTTWCMGHHGNALGETIFLEVLTISWS